MRLCVFTVSSTGARVRCQKIINSKLWCLSELNGKSTQWIPLAIAIHYDHTHNTVPITIMAPIKSMLDRLKFARYTTTIWENTKIASNDKHNLCGRFGVMATDQHGLLMTNGCRRSDSVCWSKYLRDSVVIVAAVAIEALLAGATVVMVMEKAHTARDSASKFYIRRRPLMRLANTHTQTHTFHSICWVWRRRRRQWVGSLNSCWLPFTQCNRAIHSQKTMTPRDL